MNAIDKVIQHLFTTRWTGDLCNAPIEDMRRQLHKNLQNQMDGFWSGHTAYHLMIDGGFLIDAKRKYIEGTNKCEGKKLTAFGELFMARCAALLCGDDKRSVDIKYATYYRYNTGLNWICSSEYDSLKLAKIYLTLELEGLRKMNRRNPFDLDFVDIQGRIGKLTTTKTVEIEYLDI